MRWRSFVAVLLLSGSVAFAQDDSYGLDQPGTDVNNEDVNNESQIRDLLKNADWKVKAPLMAVSESMECHVRTSLQQADVLQLRDVFRAGGSRSSDELLALYGDELRSSLRTFYRGLGIDLSDEGVNAIQHSILSEIPKRVWREELRKRGSAKPLPLDLSRGRISRENGAELHSFTFALRRPDLSTIPAAATQKAVPLAVDFTWFNLRQVDMDIRGTNGQWLKDCQGWSYKVNGGNQLTSATAYFFYDQWCSDAIGCYPLYMFYVIDLWFADEDHPDPTTDTAYDLYRLATYGRIADEEYFLEDYMEMEEQFWNIWDNGKSYGNWVGQHGNNQEGMTTTIYISNVWNHAMSTNNRNCNMSYTSW